MLYIRPYRNAVMFGPPRGFGGNPGGAGGRMKSYLEDALKLRFPPLAIYYAQELPEGAKLTSPMCSMLLKER
jgi:hypothetical protein